MLIQICHHVALLDHNKLTHFPLVPHICVKRLTIIGWDNELTPNSQHHRNQCSGIVNWTFRNKYQWNINQNTKLFIHGDVCRNIVCETAAIFPVGDELTGSHTRGASRSNACYIACGALLWSYVVGIIYTPNRVIYTDICYLHQWQRLHDHRHWMCIYLSVCNITEKWRNRISIKLSGCMERLGGVWHWASERKMHELLWAPLGKMYELFFTQFLRYFGHGDSDNFLNDFDGI